MNGPVIAAMTHSSSKFRFLRINLVRGFLWFAFIITVYLMAEGYLRANFQSYIFKIQENQIFLFGIYALSEIVFGIIPPELFMMISILNDISLQGFITNLIIYALLSYMAGTIGYLIGRSFSEAKIYQRIKKKYLSEYELMLKQYGAYLLFVGAITPIPFSATCMIAGAVKMPAGRFFLVIITRLLRFIVYGTLVWTFPNWFK